MRGATGLIARLAVCVLVCASSFRSAAAGWFNPSDADMDTLGLYAAYAGAAYSVTDAWDCDNECSHPGTEGTVVEYGWNTTHVSSFGNIARNPSLKAIIVAFSGTNSAGDWVEDFDTVPNPWPEWVRGSVVIGGFLAGYLEVSREVLGWTKWLADRYPDHSIVAVGHSLGGARASMYVADLTDKYPQYTRRVKLYSYGQPKSGNEVFADYMDGLDAELIRVVNKGDTAPHLPRNDDIYKAFGTEVWINYSNRTVVCRAPDYSACSDSVSRGMQNVPDHSLYPGL